ncbi:protein N-lysine methyltransferase METTL21A-like [Tubulanus polymorphus]|uniref:protein N-lysine methyltransferase METTL21A-like n=1 Tax=Tubulanus polymorphus TaxID=672921 RepID=UPI003DA63287
MLYKSTSELLTTILLQLVIGIYTSHSYESNSEEHCSHSANSHSAPVQSLNDPQLAKCASNSNTNMALVVYEEKQNFLERFYDDKWHYTCKDKVLSVKQKWTELGVAGVVWDAATVLSDFLQGKAELVKGKKVLEIGAGTGLVGLYSNVLGAEVTITDRQEVLDHIRNVVKHNELDNSRLTVAELDWTKNYPEFGTFDVIVGADVIYIESLFQDLLKTLTNLSNSETVVFLSCKIRYDKDWRFIDMLKKTMHVEEVLHDKDRDIRIFKANKVV